LIIFGKSAAFVRNGRSSSSVIRVAPWKELGVLNARWGMTSSISRRANAA
jgi:hypothetical protein